MARFWQAIRSGSWLTQDRMRGYSILLVLIPFVGSVIWIAMSDHLIDLKGKPLGTDFSNVYAAGVLALNGKAPDAYDPPHQHAAEKAVFDGRDVPFFGWHYPPFFFAVAALVATLPYVWGLVLWLVSSGMAFLITMRAILPRFATQHETQAMWLAVVAFPAVFINIGHGQNGFMTAALLGAGLQLLDRRPIVAGILIGLLAYKPQFGVLVPLALMVSGRWTTIAAAGATVITLVAATFAIFGKIIWQAFAASTSFTQHVVLEQGGTGWEKIQSIFSAARMWGANVPTAYAVQFFVAVMLAASLTWLWRSHAAYELKASALATACLLATPYVLDYDLVVLAVSIAFFVRHGLKHHFHDFEMSLLAAAWTVPLITRSIAGVTGIPLGLLVTMTLYIFTLRRAVSDLGGVRIFNRTLVRQ